MKCQDWLSSFRGEDLCEFPIGSYVKLSSAVGAILVKGPNHQTHEENHPMSHPNLDLIEQMVSDKKIFMGISWSGGRTAGHIFGREPSNDYFII